jgi:hypothetical protein
MDLRLNKDSFLNQWFERTGAPLDGLRLNKQSRHDVAIHVAIPLRATILGGYRDTLSGKMSRNIFGMLPKWQDAWQKLSGPHSWLACRVGLARIVRRIRKGHSEFSSPAHGCQILPLERFRQPVEKRRQASHCNKLVRAKLEDDFLHGLTLDFLLRPGFLGCFLQLAPKLRRKCGHIIDERQLMMR